MYERLVKLGLDTIDEGSLDGFEYGSLLHIGIDDGPSDGLSLGVELYQVGIDHGSLVGFQDGSLLDVELGIEDGSSGAKLGINDGSLDGFEDGSSLGVELGIANGSLDGFEVGLSLGVELGIGDGIVKEAKVLDRVFCQSTGGAEVTSRSQVKLFN
jgi:hypothetical protein